MKSFVAPNGKVILIPKGRIMVYGLSFEEISIIQKNIPSDDHEVYVPHVIQDVLALPYETLIVKSETLTQEEYNMIIEFYSDLNGCFDESVFWIGLPKPPRSIRNKFVCYDTFQQLASVLPEKLLKAHQKVKKSKRFSKNLADCLLILSLIRSNPGIKTQKLSEKLELPTRTIQRHIAALQATGEWIEYDTKKRGWKLQYGISILFGDHLVGN